MSSQVDSRRLMQQHGERAGRGAYRQEAGQDGPQEEHGELFLMMLNPRTTRGVMSHLVVQWRGVDGTGCSE